MKFLLDEMLNARTAATMRTLGSEDGDDYVYLLEHDSGLGGTSDEGIPPICKAGGFDALITANHKDFAARKVLWLALIEAGTHLLVLRPKKQKFTVDLQVSFLARFRHHTREAFAAGNGAGVLVVVSEGAMRTRTIEQLIAEVEGETRLP